MPMDQLNLDAEVRVITAIRTKEETLNNIFLKVLSRPYEDNDRVTIISMSDVYNLYAANVVRDVSRNILTQYSINEVMTRRDTISKQIENEANERLKDTPIVIIQLGFADIQPPEVIVRANEVAAERSISIQQAEAEREVELVKARTSINLAERDRTKRLIIAQTIADENRIVAETVTDKYIQYRNLEVMEAATKSDNTVFFPYEIMGNTGFSNRVFGK